MIETLQKSNFDPSQLTVPSSTSSGTSASKDTPVAALSAQSKRYSSQQRKVQDKKESAKTKIRRVVNRRRRRRGNESDSSEEEGAGGDNEGSESSDDTLSALSSNLGEDDLEMFERLSDGSSTDDESKEDSTLSSPEKSPPKSTPSLPLSTSTPPVSTKKGKRQIVLAANFGVAPGSKSELKEGSISRELEDDAPTPVSREQSSLATSDTLGVDDSLRYLMHKSGFQSTVHTVCCLVAEESYLMPLRVFMEWLQSCPIAVTASSQVSAFTYLKTMLQEVFCCVA